MMALKNNTSEGKEVNLYSTRKENAAGQTPVSIMLGDKFAHFDGQYWKVIAIEGKAIHLVACYPDERQQALIASQKGSYEKKFRLVIRKVTP